MIEEENYTVYMCKLQCKKYKSNISAAAGVAKMAIRNIQKDGIMLEELSQWKFGRIG